jgi:hypothetical protein
MEQALLGMEPDVPEFTYEGQANYDPNQPPPGPAIETPEMPKVKGVIGPKPDLPEDFQATGEANYDPSNRPPGPSAGGSTGIEPQTFEEALAAAMDKGSPKAPSVEEAVEPMQEAPAAEAAEAPAKPVEVNMTEPTVVPDNDPRVAPPVPASAKPRIRVTAEGKQSSAGVYKHPQTGEDMHPIASVFDKSKSRRGRAFMSATPGYTKADMDAMGLDPNVKHTHITKAQAAAGKAARAERTTKYYARAIEDREAGLGQ